MGSLPHCELYQYMLKISGIRSVRRLLLQCTKNIVSSVIYKTWIVYTKKVSASAITKSTVVYYVIRSLLLMAHYTRRLIKKPSKKRPKNLLATNNCWPNGLKTRGCIVRECWIETQHLLLVGQRNPPGTGGLKTQS